MPDYLCIDDSVDVIGIASPQHQKQFQVVQTTAFSAVLKIDRVIGNTHFLDLQDSFTLTSLHQLQITNARFSPYYYKYKRKQSFPFLRMEASYSRGCHVPLGFPALSLLTSRCHDGLE